MPNWLGHTISGEIRYKGGLILFQLVFGRILVVRASSGLFVRLAVCSKKYRRCQSVGKKLKKPSKNGRKKKIEERIDFLLAYSG